MSDLVSTLQDFGSMTPDERSRGMILNILGTCGRAADQITALEAKVARYEEALEELSCRHVTEGPLWWQSIARNVLESAE